MLKATFWSLLLLIAQYWAFGTLRSWRPPQKGTIFDPQKGSIFGAILEFKTPDFPGSRGKKKGPKKGPKKAPFLVTFWGPFWTPKIAAKATFWSLLLLLRKLHRSWRPTPKKVNIWGHFGVQNPGLSRLSRVKNDPQKGPLFWCLFEVKNRTFTGIWL